MIQAIQWLMAVIVVEAIVEIIVDSELFMPWRVFISKRTSIVGRFLGKLSTCGYCASVWVSALIAWALPGHVFSIYIADIFIRIFLLHRLSNIVHELFHRWLNRHPFGLFINFFTGKAEESNTTIEIPEDIIPEEKQ